MPAGPGPIQRIRMTPAGAIVPAARRAGTETVLPLRRALCYCSRSARLTPGPRCWHGFLNGFGSRAADSAATAVPAGNDAKAMWTAVVGPMPGADFRSRSAPGSDNHRDDLANVRAATAPRSMLTAFRKASYRLMMRRISRRRNERSVCPAAKLLVPEALPVHRSEGRAKAIERSAHDGVNVRWPCALDRKYMTVPCRVAYGVHQEVDREGRGHAAAGHGMPATPVAGGLSAGKMVFPPSHAGADSDPVCPRSTTTEAIAEPGRLVTKFDLTAFRHHKYRRVMNAVHKWPGQVRIEFGGTPYPYRDHVERVVRDLSCLTKLLIYIHGKNQEEPGLHANFHVAMFTRDELDALGRREKLDAESLKYYFCYVVLGLDLQLGDPYDLFAAIGIVDDLSEACRTRTLLRQADDAVARPALEDRRRLLVRSLPPAPERGRVLVTSICRR